MVFKYQKQPAKKESNYTKNKLIYVYIFVYIPKRDPNLGLLMYNPGEEHLVD